MVGGGQVDPLPGTLQQHLGINMRSWKYEQLLKLAENSRDSSAVVFQSPVVVCQSYANIHGSSVVNQLLWFVSCKITVVVCQSSAKRCGSSLDTCGLSGV